MSPEAETGKEAVVDTQQAELVSPDQEGSLSDIISKQTGTVFSGHPAEEGAAGPEGEKPEDRTEGGEPAAKPEDKAKPAEDAAPQFKHQTWEETEKARVEAERAMHAAKEEAATLRKEKEERDAADKVAAETAKAIPQPTPEEVRAAAKAKVKATLKTIGSLDEEDPEYDEKVAEAWADAGLGAPSVAAAPDKAEIAKLVEEQVTNTLKAEREATAEKDRAAEIARTRENAQDMAAKAGLKMDKGTVDYRLFWDVAQEIPKELSEKPLKEQVDWAIDEVHRLKGDIVKTKEEKAAEAKKVQLRQQPLERGPERVPAKPSSEGYSINSIVSKQQETRRI